MRPTWPRPSSWPPTVDEQAVERVRAWADGDDLIGILGSSSFHHPRSAAFCFQLGYALARQAKPVRLVTGGVTGIPEAVTVGFLHACSASEGVLHLVPPGYPHPAQGDVVEVGPTMVDRREVLAHVARAYVCIEGGPGTAHEVRMARDREALVVPVGWTGGVAAVEGGASDEPADLLVEARQVAESLMRRPSTDA